jgi:hypothetical protein
MRSGVPWPPTSARRGAAVGRVLIALAEPRPSGDGDRPAGVASGTPVKLDAAARRTFPSCRHGFSLRTSRGKSIAIAKRGNRKYRSLSYFNYYCNRGRERRQPAAPARTLGNKSRSQPVQLQLKHFFALPDVLQKH